MSDSSDKLLKLTRPTYLQDVANLTGYLLMQFPYKCLTFYTRTTHTYYIHNKYITNNVTIL